MSENKIKRICWVITGAGHFLKESVDLIDSLDSLAAGRAVDVFMTRAAKEVVTRYGVREKLEGGGRQVYHETDYSGNASIYFSGGRYERLVISPATSNTVAKCVLGIADSLASIFFAQAGKSDVPIIVLPTDVEPEMASPTPSGKTISVRPREIDLRHTDSLAGFPGVVVVRSVAALRGALGGSGPWSAAPNPVGSAIPRPL